MDERRDAADAAERDAGGLVESLPVSVSPRLLIPHPLACARFSAAMRLRRPGWWCRRLATRW